MKKCKALRTCLLFETLTSLYFASKEAEVLVFSKFFIWTFAAFHSFLVQSLHVTIFRAIFFCLLSRLTLTCESVEHKKKHLIQ